MPHELVSLSSVSLVLVVLLVKNKNLMIHGCRTEVSGLKFFLICTARNILCDSKYNRGCKKFTKELKLLHCKFPNFNMMVCFGILGHMLYEYFKIIQNTIQLWRVKITKVLLIKKQCSSGRLREWESGKKVVTETIFIFDC